MHLIRFKWANDGACFGFAYGMSSAVHCLLWRRHGASIVYCVRNMHFAVVWPFSRLRRVSAVRSIGRTWKLASYLKSFPIWFGCGMNFILLTWFASHEGMNSGLYVLLVVAYWMWRYTASIISLLYVYNRGLSVCMFVKKILNYCFQFHYMYFEHSNIY